MSQRDVNDIEERLRRGEARVTSPHDGAVFWSNDVHGTSRYPHNRWRADVFCREGDIAGDIHRVILEQTPDGRSLDESWATAVREGRAKTPADTTEAKERKLVETALSQQYAASASGTVHTFCIGSRLNSHFRKEELPGLLANPRVESINGVDLKSLRALYQAGPDGREACFNRVCQAELARDRAWASTIGESKGPADYKHREEAFLNQLKTQGRTPETAVAVRGRQAEATAGAAAVVPTAEVARMAEQQQSVSKSGGQAVAATGPRSRTGKAWAEVQARKGQETAVESRGLDLSPARDAQSPKPTNEIQRSR